MTSSGAGQDVDAFPGAEYDAIEHAVMESPRGRWFLGEYAKRNRTADTRALLSALKKLEDAVGGRRQAEPSTIPGLAQAFAKTRAEIAALRNDLLTGGGVIANDNNIFDRIADEALSHASRFTRHSDELAQTSAALRNAESGCLDVLDAQVHVFRDLSRSNELLSERIVRAMGLLTHIGRHIATASDAETAARETRYFAADGEIFEPPRAAHPQPQAGSEPSRITVTRRISSGDIAIPFAGEFDGDTG